jgi:hypothetical protein
MPPLDLIERYLEGELTSADQSLLEEWLRADREHLRILLREVHLSGAGLESDPEAEERPGHWKLLRAAGLQLLVSFPKGRARLGMGRNR